MPDTSTLTQSLDAIASLRLIVGYLGEQKQGGWWDCDFVGPTGIRILEMAFPRTARRAALMATTEAACATHDRALGRIGTYHLFRLPSAVEDRLEERLGTFDWAEFMEKCQSKKIALQVLQAVAVTRVKGSEGPIKLGSESSMLKPSALRDMAAHYDAAFREEIRSFPYFARDPNAR